MASDILIVDDEGDIRELVAGILNDEGYDTRSAADSDRALAALEARRPGLVILDIWLQGSKLDGLELLDLIRERHPEVPVVIISGHGNIETAVSAIKKGAYDFIEKPFKADRLILIVRRALEAFRLRRENSELRARAGDDTTLIGFSPAMAQVRQTIDKVAPTGSRVLITGPSGCGKEVVARLLHARSRRAVNAFVAINAANMAPERMEVELFGTEESAAGPRKVGEFEQAHGGMLFLDEVAEMPIETQSKILRVLVDQTFERVGGGPKVKVDVRVVSSSSRDLLDEIARGRLREDLFHRLNVVPISLPALRERREDVILLARHFLERAAQEGLPRKTLADDATQLLMVYHWPGNVRELQNMMQRLAVLSRENVITGEILRNMLPLEAVPADYAAPPDHLAHAVRDWARRQLGVGIGQPNRNLHDDLLAVIEPILLQEVLATVDGNQIRAAGLLGINRNTLRKKLTDYGLDPLQLRLID